METAYIALGGNLPSAAGTPEATLAAAVEHLGTLGRVTRRSHLYSTAPVGYAEQPRFVNAVVALETLLSAHTLLEKLLGIEKFLGRNRDGAIANGPRTLDLDILLYGQQIYLEPDLRVPHPRLAERAFVLVPLGEIAPEVIVPKLDRSVKELLESLRAHAADETDAILTISSDLWRA